MTARLPDPTGYGRVVRSRDGRVAGIVEEADATAEERAIDEVGTSIYVFRRSVLAPALRRLSPDNSQGEYYLTDVIAVLHDAGYPVTSLVVPDPIEASGVNDRCQLASAEAVLRARVNQQLDEQGRHHVRPAKHVPRLDRRAGRRCDPFARDDPSGDHESGHRRRDWPWQSFGRLRRRGQGTGEGDFCGAGDNRRGCARGPVDLVGAGDGSCAGLGRPAGDGAYGLDGG